MRLERFGAVLLCPESCEFPSSLLAIADPPAVLFCQGDLSLLSQPSVALIGSRAATEYGRRVAGQLGRELSQHGLVVVSGAAYGIDGAAHTGALESDGKTVAILGCGLDVAYPKPHAPLLAHIAAHGALLSEYPLATQPEAFRFPCPKSSYQWSCRWGCGRRGHGKIWIPDNSGFSAGSGKRGYGSSRSCRLA